MTDSGAADAKSFGYRRAFRPAQFPTMLERARCHQPLRRGRGGSSVCEPASGWVLRSVSVGWDTDPRVFGAQAGSAPVGSQ